MKNYNQFYDLEQKILSTWSIVDDLLLLRKFISDMPTGRPSEDEVDNFILGLHTIYGAKFEVLFRAYETLIKSMADES